MYQAPFDYQAYALRNLQLIDIHRSLPAFSRPFELPFKNERADGFTYKKGITFSLSINLTCKNWPYKMARYIDQELLNLCLAEALQAYIFADTGACQSGHQSTQRVRCMHLIGPVEHKVERSRAGMRAGTIKGINACALGHQEIKQLHCSRISPLQIVQDNDEWTFLRQCLKNKRRP